MANDIGLPPGTIDSARVVPGAVVRAADVAPLVGLVNLVLAYAGTGPAFQQSWPGDVVEYSGDPLEDEEEAPIPLCSWRIPRLSDAHASLAIEVRGRYVAGTGEGGASVTLRSRVTGDSVTAALPEVEAWVALDPLEIGGELDRGVVDYIDEIELFVASSGGADHYAILTQIAAEWPPLDDPLPEAAVDDAAPMDVAVTVADVHLSTPIGHAILDALDAVRRRPRMGAVWSGINAAYLASLPAEAAALVGLPAGVGVLTADEPIDELLGVVAHVRQVDEAGFDRVYPLRAVLPPADGPVWLSQHETAATAERIARRYLPTGAGNLAGVGATGLAIWSRELVETDAGDPWQSEAEL